jgi:hypothetical protein
MRLANSPQAVAVELQRHRHRFARAPLSRRSFLGGAAATGVALAASGAVHPASALAKAAGRAMRAPSAAPKPIPTTIPGYVLGDPGNNHLYHLLPPFPPGSDGQVGQYSDCSTITDFRGFLGAANINGTGSGSPTETNPQGRYDFNVDMRFTQGEYVGVDGRKHQGTFGFL